MVRLFLIPCLIVGVMLCGCSSPQSTETNWAHQPPNEVNSPPLPTSSEWIAAGAVATTGEPPAPPPASLSREYVPVKEDTWSTKMRKKGMHAMETAFTKTCEMAMVTLVITAGLGVIVLYCVAAGNVGGLRNN